MNRRVFTVGGLAALVIPGVGDAQQRPHRIGMLTGNPEGIEAFKRGLADLGYVEGQNFIIEHRDARGGFEGLSATFEALVQLPVDVIVVSGSESVQAAKKATQTIPVVFTNVGDPIEQGFIASYAKPGRNITGVTNMVSELTAKWLEIFTELQSRIKRVAVLWNPPQPAHRGLLNAMQSAASTLGLQLRPMAVRTIDEVRPT